MKILVKSARVSKHSRMIVLQMKLLENIDELVKETTKNKKFEW
jgi:hypothetical protein